jgi:hypothetical protein
LTPASRRQNHTTWPYALVHSSTLARLNKSVHHSLSPTFRDDREAPLMWAEDAAIYNSDLPNLTSGIFLIPGLDMISENQK